jgi:NAD(P)-dependent dehydrogenase (short-subunit alcohol dehydrogenase family)
VTTVVTGAATGIGRAIASAMAARGRVVAVDVDEAGVSALAKEHESVIPITGDVADPATHDRAVEAVDGDISGWVNNAAVAIAGSIHELDPDDYRRLMSINLDGYVWGLRAATRAMLERGGGAIVNVSSTQAILGFRGYPAYAAAKGAVEALTRQVAAEYADRGIRCNAVAPGVILTEMNRQVLAESDDPDALRELWDLLCPIGRWGKPADVAAGAVYLLDPERSGFVTGQVIVIDGAQTIAPPKGL